MALSKKLLITGFASTWLVLPAFAHDTHQRGHGDDNDHEFEYCDDESTEALELCEFEDAEEHHRGHHGNHDHGDRHNQRGGTQPSSQNTTAPQNNLFTPGTNVQVEQN